jgi:opacity protein-like surface antigen
MKKIIFHLTAVLFFCVAGFSTYAQISVGGGLIYHTELSYIGVNARAQIDAAELGSATLGVVPQATYYFAESGFTWIEFVADANLGFGDVDEFTAYPILGLRYDIITVSFFGISATDGEFGFNAGAGAQYAISDNLKAYLEAKYQGYFSEFGGTPISIGAGVLFTLGN